MIKSVNLLIFALYQSFINACYFSMEKVWVYFTLDPRSIRSIFGAFLTRGGFWVRSLPSFTSWFFIPGYLLSRHTWNQSGCCFLAAIQEHVPQSLLLELFLLWKSVFYFPKPDCGKLAASVCRRLLYWKRLSSAEMPSPWRSVPATLLIVLFWSLLLYSEPVFP